MSAPASTVAASPPAPRDDRPPGERYYRHPGDVVRLDRLGLRRTAPPAVPGGRHGDERRRACRPRWGRHRRADRRPSAPPRDRADCRGRHRRRPRRGVGVAAPLAAAGDGGGRGGVGRGGVVAGRAGARRAGPVTGVARRRLVAALQPLPVARRTRRCVRRAHRGLALARSPVAARVRHRRGRVDRHDGAGGDRRRPRTAPRVGRRRRGRVGGAGGRRRSQPPSDAGGGRQRPRRHRVRGAATRARSASSEDAPSSTA